MEGSTEGMRIYSLFEDMYDGEPWLGVSIVPSLSGLTADQAAARPFDNCNTIWEIVNHMILWRGNVLMRLDDLALETPENNYIQKVVDTSAESWIATLMALEKSQKEWKSYLEEVTEEDFKKIYEPNKMDYYKHAHGILQHDAYHLGQIILLLKFV